MKAAFHFDYAHDGYPRDVEIVVAQGLHSLPAHRLHVRISLGDPILFPHARTKTREGLSLVAQDLFSASPRLLTSDIRKMHDALATTNVYCVMVDGLITSDATTVHSYLEDAGPFYLGMLEIDDTHTLLRRAYTASMPEVYHMTSERIGLLHESGAVEFGAVDDYEVERWASTRLFGLVEWEDQGARGTIFDDWATDEARTRIGSTQQLLQDQIEIVSAQILLHCGVVDPRLVDALHAALDRLESVRTPEEAAQAALSCRRFLERLADVLYPPRDEAVGNRNVSQPAYRNRLWAFVESNSDGRRQEVTLSSLRDVGGRIDALDAYSNKGLHDQLAPTELHRLIIGLVTLTYDLFSISTSLPTFARDAHTPAVQRFLRQSTADYEDD